MGGNGGHGGSVRFRCCPSKRSLNHIKSVLKGGNGHPGHGDYKNGARGSDTQILVPIGTVIGCSNAQESITTLLDEDDVFEAVCGGIGGMGNHALLQKRRINNPSQYKRYQYFESESGEPGNERNYFLEMKTIADVGLVGLPNAGKSSVLRALSKAKPKVASYPFTTMRPHVGVVHYEGFNRVQMADIPGLIEGSSLGYGLGISFLKHIDRCKSLLYVVDVSNFEYNPVETINILQKELNAYKPCFSDSVIGVIANKIDLISNKDVIIDLAKEFPNLPIVPLSAKHRVNVSSARKLLEPYKVLHAD